MRDEDKKRLEKSHQDVFKGGRRREKVRHKIKERKNFEHEEITGLSSWTEGRDTCVSGPSATKGGGVERRDGAKMPSINLNKTHRSVNSTKIGRDQLTFTTIPTRRDGAKMPSINLHK